MKLSNLVRLAQKDRLPGGLGDQKTDQDFDKRQLDQGVKVEMEHTSDPELAREIVRDHLTEDPQYYEKLKTIEPEHGNVEGGKDPKIDELKKQIEDMDRTIDQLKRRQEALTGPEVNEQTAEVIAPHRRGGRRQERNPNPDPGIDHAEVW
jgi:hypothetical protein